MNRDVISLFAGAMGLDAGLMKAGLRLPVGLAEALEKALIATAEGNAAIQTKRRSKNIMRDRSPAMLCP